MSASETSSEAESEEGKLLGQQAAFRGEHDARPGVGDPDPGAPGAFRGPLPCNADVGEEPCAPGTVLVE